MAVITRDRLVFQEQTTFIKKKILTQELNNICPKLK